MRSVGGATPKLDLTHRATSSTKNFSCAAKLQRRRPASTPRAAASHRSARARRRSSWRTCRPPRGTRPIARSPDVSGEHDCLWRNRWDVHRDFRPPSNASVSVMSSPLIASTRAGSSGPSVPTTVWSSIVAPRFPRTGQQNTPKMTPVAHLSVGYRFNESPFFGGTLRFAARG